MKEFICWLQSFLSEPDGKGSSRRVIEFGIAWTFIFSYIRVALMTQNLPPLDIGWTVMIGGILGLKSIDAYVKGKLTNGNTEKPS